MIERWAVGGLAVAMAVVLLVLGGFLLHAGHGAVTATEVEAGPGSSKGVMAGVGITYYQYLPLVLRPNIEVHAPDLVARSLTANTNGVVVVVENRGDAPVVNSFWVDVYIDPHPIPGHVNQTWDQVSKQGLVWGVRGDALPIDVGGAITLTVGDDYYWPDRTLVSWPLTLGLPVYVQVDSANVDTFYGGVPEIHEILGTEYNNVHGPAYVGYGPAAVTGKGGASGDPGALPARP